MQKKRIVILGGGFGGVYTAMELEKRLKKSHDIILINRENYFVYQPMLPEVVGGSLGLIDTVSPLRKLLPKTILYIREIASIDIKAQTVTLSPEFSHTPKVIGYDHLVLALGNTTNFRGAPGLHEHALAFKNLADAVTIRNRLIAVMESAETETDKEKRKKMLTFVVAGGGFSGTEVVAELNDLVRRIAKKSPLLNEKEIRVVLVHNKKRLMDRELSTSLSAYAAKILQERGVEIIYEKRLDRATPEGAFLDDGTKIDSKTVISTVPSSPNPLIETLGLPLEKGRIKTNRTLQVTDNIWALGDCAAIPLNEKESCPTTAQFAVRMGTHLAKNICATLEEKEIKEFKFNSLGVMGALGHHRAVAELFGKIKLQGFIAWFFWRTVYLAKIPGLARKFKIALNWFVDMLIPMETVQLNMGETKGMIQLHYEKGGVVFYQGDVGDYLYMILSGKVEVLIDGKEISCLGQGEFFGEMALLEKKPRSATIRCKEATDLLAIPRDEFGILTSSFAELKKKFNEMAKTRTQVE